MIGCVEYDFKTHAYHPLTGETLVAVDVTPRTYGTDCAIFDFEKREFIDISSTGGSEKTYRIKTHPQMIVAVFWNSASQRMRLCADGDIIFASYPSSYMQNICVFDFAQLSDEPNILTKHQNPLIELWADVP